MRYYIPNNCDFCTVISGTPFLKQKPEEKTEKCAFEVDIYRTHYCPFSTYVIGGRRSQIG